MSRDLRVGDVLGEVFSIYGSEAGTLLPLAFWLFLAVAIVDGLIGRSVALLPVTLALSTIAGTLYQGTVVELVHDVQDGRRDFSALELVRGVLPVLLPLIVAGLLAGIAIGIGFLLLIAPGLFLATIWAVIAPVIVVERSGALAAFGRSRALVRGQGWAVCGAIVVAFLVAIVGAAIFASIGGAIATGPLVRIVFSALASTVTAPISALVASVLYFRLRALQPAPGTLDDTAAVDVPR
jgi:hypothetical protein